MKQLIYIGNNKPLGMVIEVEDSEVKRLLDSGNYELVGGKKDINIKPKEQFIKDGDSKRTL